ncbi:MAG: hypothetical protein ACRENP_05885 [Longimicrobiales bacterium]
MKRAGKFHIGLAVALMALAGCASTRSVSVGSDVTYRLEVVNQMPQAMTVFWSDGGEPRMLGSVGSGRTESFVIAGAGSTNVSITARDAGGTRRGGPYSVTLEAGVVKRVVVR